MTQHPMGEVEKKKIPNVSKSQAFLQRGDRQHVVANSKSRMHRRKLEETASGKKKKRKGN